MITYLIEAALIHLSLYLIYLFLLRKETHYQLRRGYLLGATIASVTVPFLNVPLLPSNKATSISTAISNTLETVVIRANGADGKGTLLNYQFEWMHLFFLVSFLFLGFLIWGIRTIILNFRKSDESSLFGVKVWLLREENPSFSFFKWIFIGPEREELIVLHEKGHAIHRHTADVLLMNMHRVVFWWLPTSWWVLRELRLIHEFQADAFAMKHADAGYYKKLLIGNALSSVNMSLASSFHHGTLLKRLKAMQAKKQIISKWKLGVLGTLVATVVLVFSCSEQLEQDVQEISSNASLIVDYPPEVQKRVELLKKETGADYSVMEFHGETDKAKVEKLVANYKFAEILDLKESDNQYLILSQDNAAYAVVKEMSKSEDGVYDLVDNQDEIKESAMDFYQYIGSNMLYPEQARKLGVEGKVMVQFIVNPNGSITNVQAVKGIGAGCDAEAVRVVSEGTWVKPGIVDGKPVKTRLMIPIAFKLDS